MNGLDISKIVNMSNPQAVHDEVKSIAQSIYEDIDLSSLDSAFEDICRLFNGEYPGYQACNTGYHDLNHTTSVYLAMCRLIHGAFCDGERFGKNEILIGLLAALFHDCGYIQEDNDRHGTGAKYTIGHVPRSIEFGKEYLANLGFEKTFRDRMGRVILCTDTSLKPSNISFIEPLDLLLGKLLGSADILGQMADRAYLEKLIFLYNEFKEAGVGTFTDEYDLLNQTSDFSLVILDKLDTDLSGVNQHMSSHFRERFGVDTDPYLQSIERQINYLKKHIVNDEKNFQNYLKRQGMVKTFEEKRDTGVFHR